MVYCADEALSILNVTYLLNFGEILLKLALEIVFITLNTIRI